jgi:hypothetical protein
VCDEELYTLEPPQSKMDEFAAMTESVKKIVVASSKKLGASPLFKSGDVSSVDAYQL